MTTNSSLAAARQIVIYELTHGGNTQSAQQVLRDYTEEKDSPMGRAWYQHFVEACVKHQGIAYSIVHENKVEIL
jgi:hypothetical protein